MQAQTCIEYYTETVLGVWEESLKSVVRETFANAARVANGFFSWAGALLVSRESKEGPLSRTQAWKAWWQEERQSSLNAFIASHSPSSRKRQPCKASAQANIQDAPELSSWNCRRGAVLLVFRKPNPSKAQSKQGHRPFLSESIESSEGRSRCSDRHS